MKNIIVIDAKRRMYSVYIKGKFMRTVQSDRLLNKDEIEEFRRDPQTYIYGSPEPETA